MTLEERLKAADAGLLRLARTWGHTAEAERVVARFSSLGEHAAVWLAIGGVGAAVDRRRREWLRAAETVAGVYALNTAIKLVVRRPRPRVKGLPPLTKTPTPLGFPSAHASTSFAGAFAYSRLGLPALPLYALAAKLSYSRVYLGVHYPSDVLAGALLGSAVAALRSRSSGDDADAPASAPASAAVQSNGHVPRAFAAPAAWDVA